MLPLPIHWVWSWGSTLLFPLNEVGIGILRDFVDMGHPVLEAPPLAVSKDEIERKLRM